VRALVLAAALLAPGLAFAQQQLPLWPKGAPGFESRRDIPEQAADYWAKSINNPSVTVWLPPKDKATGAALIVLPGGGIGYVLGSAKTLDCTFRPTGGRRGEDYSGAIRKLGVDLQGLTIISPSEARASPGPRGLRHGAYG